MAWVARAVLLSLFFKSCHDIVCTAGEKCLRQLWRACAPPSGRSNRRHMACPTCREPHRVGVIEALPKNVMVLRMLPN